MRRRLALIVSHPIQYYVPLYQRLAQRDDLLIKVFFTWHAAESPVEDRGFRRTFRWDIPLTDGYDYELVRNVAVDPGTHHFFGLRNPTLFERVTAWQPDVVHVTGWAWLSHLLLMRALKKTSIPILFRGDSHLLDETPRGLRWWAKRTVLGQIFSWPSGFLFVGKANQAYYRMFGVSGERLVENPHSIDVARFATSAAKYEREAAIWRRQLGIGADCCVVLFAGKFERKKQPLQLMRAVQALPDRRTILLLVGSGELEGDVRAMAALDPERFHILPAQNQSRMPIVYRLGDIFVLPSAYGETWGLAVNEAMACGRAVLVSDRVGCAYDLVDASCGRIFAAGDAEALIRSLAEMTENRPALRSAGQAAVTRAWAFDVRRTEAGLAEAVKAVSPK